MRFIELHRPSDGKAIMVNLSEIECIRPANDGDGAIVEWRQLYQGHDPMPLPTQETYKDIRGLLAAAKVLTL